MDFLSALNAGSSLLSTVGGLFGGKGPNRKDAERAAWESVKIQKHLWETQLPSLVSGAKAAGLHPLVAAGVNPASGPTVGVVGDTGSSAIEKLGNLGQGLGRSVQAYQAKDQRAYTEAAQKLALEKAALENDLLRSQITTINRPTTPPLSGNTTGTNQGSEYLSVTPPAAKQQVDFGTRWQPNPRISNAEDIEARYGELGDWIWGPVALASDAGYNAYKWLSKPRRLRDLYNRQHQSY